MSAASAAAALTGFSRAAMRARGRHPRRRSPSSSGGRDDDDDLALRRRLARRMPRRVRASVPRAHRLERLGQFARDRRGAIAAERRRHVGKRGGEARRRLEEDQRRGNGRRAPPRRFSRAADFGGRKPAKKKLSVGRPEATSAASTAEAPGIGTTVWPAACASTTRR